VNASRTHGKPLHAAAGRRTTHFLKTHATWRVDSPSSPTMDAATSTLGTSCASPGCTSPVSLDATLADASSALMALSVCAGGREAMRGGH
jgi:hypothetical protein